ncbi:hypothetical protein COB57_05155 [Candidatus Peregrinibacteria bacterium]|nr:MAG: hypothetical protein COB57_05155 [Candidatus Peregrinibacteria bacterium]
MSYSSFVYRRQSRRMNDCDYSYAGIYFITICTKNRAALFGTIINKAMNLSAGGKIAMQCFQDISKHYPDVKVDNYVIMPNHVHAIVTIATPVTAGAQNLVPEPAWIRKNKFQHIIPRSLGAIIRGYKIGVTKWFRKNTEVHCVWQRNYHEQKIRTKKDYDLIFQYITNNPKRWEGDCFYEGE